MAGYLLCISSESGIPLFARKVGDITPIEFPLAASLNGVRVFGKSQGLQLLTTLTGSTRSVWEDFEECLSLIFVGTDDAPSDVHVRHLLRSVFHVILLHLGLDFLHSTTSVEKLKRELRPSFPLIDKLLQGLRPSDQTLYFGDLTSSADVFLQVDPNIQVLIDSFAGVSDSSFVALSSRGVTVAASKDWSQLKGQDSFLLTLKAHEVKEACAEIPIYLPLSGHKFRLVVFSFTETLRLSLLCGEEPPLTLLKKEVKKLEGRAGELFLEVEDLAERLAASYKYFILDKAIAGFLVVNTVSERCAFALSSENHCSASPLKTSQKLETLRVFYRNTLDSIFSFEARTYNRGEPRVKESLWASEYHKCHALRVFPYQLFVIYERETSHGLMRSTSQRLLQELMKERVMR